MREEQPRPPRICTLVCPHWCGLAKHMHDVLLPEIRKAERKADSKRHDKEQGERHRQDSAYHEDLRKRLEALENAIDMKCSGRPIDQTETFSLSYQTLATLANSTYKAGHSLAGILNAWAREMNVSKPQPAVKVDPEDLRLARLAAAEMDAEESLL